MVTTTVFTSGNSQAVRIPKELRLDAKQVEIERIGEMLILFEHPLSAGDVFDGFTPNPDAPYFDDSSDPLPEPIDDRWQ